MGVKREFAKKMCDRFSCRVTGEAFSLPLLTDDLLTSHACQWVVPEGDNARVRIFATTFLEAMPIDGGAFNHDE